MSDYDNYPESTIQQRHLLPLIPKNSSSRIVLMCTNHDYVHESYSLNVKYAC